MKASAIQKTLHSLIAARQPVFLWGGPGIGKSAVVRQLAASMSIPLQDVRALLLDPVDLRGLPFLSDGRSKWATPDFLPQNGSGILFLDELNAAPAMVQASCYQLVLDRKLGEYTLPKDWTIVAAGNRDSDRAVTTRMPTPLRNRFVHLEFGEGFWRYVGKYCYGQTPMQTFLHSLSLTREKRLDSVQVPSPEPERSPAQQSAGPPHVRPLDQPHFQIEC